MHKPEGYKELLVYQRAEELRDFVFKITDNFPISERRRKEHMRDSARSVKQNIVEGWKRSTTKEYYDFLSFSLGSLGELKEDGGDCFKDGLIEKKTFEELMNRCREEDYLLNRLKQSLYQKMEKEGTLPAKEKYQILRQEVKQEKDGLQKFLKKSGFARLEDGRYIKGPLSPLSPILPLNFNNHRNHHRSKLKYVII